MLVEGVNNDKDNISDELCPAPKSESISHIIELENKQNIPLQVYHDNIKYVTIH